MVKPDKSRYVYLYLPSNEDKQRWGKLATEAGSPLSKFVIEIVENALAEESDFRPRGELSKEIGALRSEIKALRDEIHSVVMRFLSTNIDRINSQRLPTTPEDLQDEMGMLYDFLAVARTPIHHDRRTGTIDELPEPEFPTRIANTITRLCEVHALIYGRYMVGLEDCEFGIRIVRDNIPTMGWQVLSVLESEWITTSQIAKKADLSTGATRYILDELTVLQLAEKLTREEKDEGMDRRADSFKLSSTITPIIEKLKPTIRIGGTFKKRILNYLNISQYQSVCLYFLLSC